MGLADTRRAIGAVTQLLKDRLLATPGGLLTDVTIGRPEPVAGLASPRVNLFLYEVDVDGFLRNHPIDDTQPDPLWLALRYLVTAFDNAGESDSIEAYELLGSAVRALHGLNFLSLAGVAANTISALDPNPEPMKLSFQEASSELLAKLMQGSDEKYRCSMAFEIRPVMIAADTVASYSLLVGVDYSTSTVIGEDGIRLPVLPSMGPSIEALSPSAAEPGGTLSLVGTDLQLAGLFVKFGPVELAATAQQPDTLRCIVDGDLTQGAEISAGAHPVSVAQVLPSGRVRASKPLIAGLRPVLSSVVPQAIIRTNPADPASSVIADLVLDGVLLGTERDDVFVGLYRGGATIRLFDAFTTIPPPVTPQTSMVVSIPTDQAVEQGEYVVILRVNGQQALSSPLVDLTAP